MTSSSNGVPREPGTTVMRATVDNVDRYAATVAGLRIEVVRAGVGRGPNDIQSVTDGRVSANAPTIGFPTLVRTAVGDDSLILACVESAPPGTHWCGRDVNAGEIFVYGPGTEHTGVNVPGLRFKFVVLGVGDMHQRADETGWRIGDIDHAFVTRLPRSPGALAATQVLTDLFDLPNGQAPPRWCLDQLLTAVTGALVRPRVSLVPRAHQIIDCRRIVNVCVEYARRVERRPMVHELCRVAAVSERSLRQAFISAFDMPPTVFFRLWALSEAHRRLASGERSSDTVTRVALDVGFGHLGRFSDYYQQAYGELPSQTLRASHPQSALIDAADIG